MGVRCAVWVVLLLVGSAGCASAAADEITPAASAVPEGGDDGAAAAAPKRSSYALDCFIWDVRRTGIVRVATTSEPIRLKAVDFRGAIVWQTDVAGGARDWQTEITIEEPGYYRLSADGDASSLPFLVIPVNDLEADQLPI